MTSKVLGFEDDGFRITLKGEAMSRPRVTASHEQNAMSHQKLTQRDRYVSPHVLVEVDFDLHDHEAALADLRFAVQRVTEQIEETHE